MVVVDALHGDAAAAVADEPLDDSTAIADLQAFFDHAALEVNAGGGKEEEDEEELEWLSNKDAFPAVETMEPVGARRVMARSVAGQVCQHCGTERTPLWREGPEGRHTLCNACGVRYRAGELVPEYRPLKSPTFSPELHSNVRRRVVEMRRHRGEESAKAYGSEGKGGEELERPAVVGQRRCRPSGMEETPGDPASGQRLEKTPRAAAVKAMVWLRLVGAEETRLAPAAAAGQRMERTPRAAAVKAMAWLRQCRLVETEETLLDPATAAGELRRVSSGTEKIPRVPAAQPAAALAGQLRCGPSETEKTLLVPAAKPAAATAGRPGRCRHCGTEETPQWRQGPEGRHTLCNACGVRYKAGRLAPEYRPLKSPTFSPAMHSNRHRCVVELARRREEASSAAIPRGIVEMCRSQEESPTKTSE